ncbi:MAG TPA: AAA family ATPase [Steroidobacteraceae bacterium]|nr:AAA family ATPase [Steroidobacteraceae bacterium]
MTDIKELELLVASRTPIILVETVETARVEELFRRLTARTGRPLFRWALATGMQVLEAGEHAGVAPSLCQKPTDLLQHVLQAKTAGLYMLLDLHRVLDDPVVLSQLQTFAGRHGETPHTLVLVGAEITLPNELRSFSAKIELSLPTLQELEAFVHEEAAAWGTQNQKRVQAKQDAIAALTRNLVGISAGEARRLIRAAIHDDGIVDESDLVAVIDAKYKLLDQGGVLSFEPVSVRLSDVAGLGKLKQWLENRREVFLSNEPPKGLDPPKGLLLLGVQGGGKSLAAKSVAGAWGLPLLRLDFATLYNKYYGETERNLRESLKTAGLMAPCVLWIDEIEKGLASDGDDGGPGKRVLGTLLTWMAERKNKVFLVATANDIQALPPELLRKGRFDEIFFVDLPSESVRAGIFAIHLKKRGMEPDKFDGAALAAQSIGFSGAEIEQAVVAALYSAHARKEELTTEHIKVEMEATKPLSVVMAERVAYLRAWAATRTVPAE